MNNRRIKIYKVKKRIKKRKKWKNINIKSNFSYSIINVYFSLTLLIDNFIKFINERK